jgi:myosin heavy subunit
MAVNNCSKPKGESGSGKTETCKHIVEHLLNRTKKFEICLNEKIQEVNPVLEAFGNAKTRINDNSSRFGKFLDIHFQEDGSVIGGKCQKKSIRAHRAVYR